jgi:hypothetical protein
MGNAPHWIWLNGACRLLSRPFRSWSTFDFLAIGTAALLLALFARHALGNGLAYNILSIPGYVFVPIGLWKTIREIG